MSGTGSSPGAAPSRTGLESISRPSAEKTNTRASRLSRMMKGRPRLSPEAAAQSATKRASAEAACAEKSACRMTLGSAGTAVAAGTGIDTRPGGRNSTNAADAINTPCLRPADSSDLRSGEWCSVTLVPRTTIGKRGRSPTAPRNVSSGQPSAGGRRPGPSTCRSRTRASSRLSIASSVACSSYRCWTAKSTVSSSCCRCKTAWSPARSSCRCSTASSCSYRPAGSSCRSMTSARRRGPRHRRSSRQPPPRSGSLIDSRRSPSRTLRPRAAPRGRMPALEASWNPAQEAARPETVGRVPTCV